MLLVDDYTVYLHVQLILATLCVCTNFDFTKVSTERSVFSISIFAPFVLPIIMARSTPLTIQIKFYFL